MKRQEGHISFFQGMILVFAILTSRLFIQFPAFVIGVGGPAAWQVTLVMTAAALMLYWPGAALARRFPGQDLREIGDALLGKAISTLLTLAFAGWLLTAATIALRIFTETFIVAILPRTPPSVLAVMVMLCVIYASYRGVEPLARATQVLFPIIAIGAFAVLLLSFPRADTSRLYPFWGYGVISTLSAGLMYGSIASEALILLVVGYAFRQGDQPGRSAFWGIILFGLTATATMATMVMIFGAPDAAQQPFPLFNMARLIYLGRFFQRVESVLVLFWFFTAAVRLSALFHTGVVALGQGLRLPLHHPLIFPVSVLMVSFSLAPKDFVTMIRMDHEWLRWAGLGALAVPCLLLLVALIRRKGGETHAA